MTHHDDVECVLCRPAIIDTKTNRPLPDTHPKMVAALSVYNALTVEEKRAFHRFAVNNDTSEENMKIMKPVMCKFQTAMMGIN